MEDQSPPDFVKGEVLLVDKPTTWTSFDVVNKLRYALAKRIGKRIKVGHAGTLDPLATGLLIICTGKMTKQIDQFQAQEKEYTGTFCIGKTTPSLDAETEVDGEYPLDHIHEALIEEARKQFLGPIQQIPPMYSAVKVDGKRLYQAARKGKVVKRDPRSVEIKEFEILGDTLPLLPFRVVCSKGTYIRSLARDFGKALQSGAYLEQLTRTRIGDFTLDKSMSLEEALSFIQREALPPKA